MGGSDSTPATTAGVPAGAKDAWLELNRLLEQVGRTPCQAGDAEAWWPNRRIHPANLWAVEACFRCPAQGACLDYALAADERFGIWGGTFPDERRARRWASDP